MILNSAKRLLVALLLTAGAFAHAVPINISDGGVIGDETTTIIYDAVSGEISVDTPASTDLTTLEITSTANVFTGAGPAMNLDGLFDVWSPGQIFKLEPAGFSSLSFGPVAQIGLSKLLLLSDLVIDGSKVGGGDLSPVVDLFYVGDDNGRVPLPGPLVLLAIGLTGIRLGQRLR